MPWFHRGLLAILVGRTDFLLNFADERWPDGSSHAWTPEQLDKVLRHFTWKETPDDPQCPERPVFILNDGKIDLLTTNFTLLMIPRGFSKTTLTNAANLYMILFQLTKFTLYISETAPHAEMQLQNIKTQLESNEVLLALWGSIVPARQSPEKWRDDYINTTTGIAVAARGRGGQIRGLLRDGARPDRITCDDLEDEESVKTPEQRKKARKWLLGTVIPAMRKMPSRGTMIVLGTVLHPDSLLMNLKNDPRFICCVFGAIDRDGDALWENNMSLSQLAKEKVSFQIAGELDTYYLEYHSQVRSDETALFNAAMFRVEILNRPQFTGVALCCDPAIGDKKDSDYCTFGVVGITERGQVHVLEAWGKRGMTPRDQIDKFFELNSIWHPTHRGVEANAYQKSLVFQIKAEQFLMAKQYGSIAYFDIHPIIHSTAKMQRIKGILAPRYRAGYITHQRRFVELEQQLIDYPGKYDDFPDVIAMCITLLDPYAALGTAPESYEADVFKNLELEIGEWRTAP